MVEYCPILDVERVLNRLSEPYSMNEVDQVAAVMLEAEWKDLSRQYMCSNQSLKAFQENELPRPLRKINHSLGNREKKRLRDSPS